MLLPSYAIGALHLFRSEMSETVYAKKRLVLISQEENKHSTFLYIYESIFFSWRDYIKRYVKID